MEGKECRFLLLNFVPCRCWPAAYWQADTVHVLLQHHVEQSNPRPWLVRRSTRRSRRHHPDVGKDLTLLLSYSSHHLKSKFTASGQFSLEISMGILLFQLLGVPMDRVCVFRKITVLLATKGTSVILKHPCSHVSGYLIFSLCFYPRSFSQQLYQSPSRCLPEYSSRFSCWVWRHFVSLASKKLSVPFCVDLLHVFEWNSVKGVRQGCLSLTCSTNVLLLLLFLLWATMNRWEVLSRRVFFFPSLFGTGKDWNVWWSEAS